MRCMKQAAFARSPSRRTTEGVLMKKDTTHTYRLAALQQPTPLVITKTVMMGPQRMPKHERLLDVLHLHG